MAEKLVDLIKHRLSSIYIGINTGNWQPFINDVKVSLLENKQIYILLGTLVVIYAFLDEFYLNPPNQKSKNASSPIRFILFGGNNETSAEPANTNDIANNSSSSTNAKMQANNTNSNNADMTSKKHALGKLSTASGLCSGDGFFAKMCQGAGSGISNIFKFLGILLLGVGALILPAIAYLILVYLVIKLMFKGLRGM